MCVSFNTFLINSHFEPPASLEITFLISELKLDRKSTLIFKQFSVLIWNKNQNWEQALIYTGEETKSCKMWERSVSPPFYLRYRYFSRFHLKLFRYNPLFSVWRLLAILRFPLHPTLNFWEKVREAEMTGWKEDDNAWSFSSKSSQSISCIFPLTLRNGSPSKLRATKAVYTKAVLFGL